MSLLPKSFAFQIYLYDKKAKKVVAAMPYITSRYSRDKAIVAAKEHARNTNKPFSIVMSENGYIRSLLAYSQAIDIDMPGKWVDIK